MATQSQSRRDVERFNRWSSSYDNSIMQRWFFDPVHARLLDMVTKEMSKQPASILDVGCGTGRLLRAASSRWPGARLLGVDPAEGMIAQARRTNPRAKFSVGPAEALPIQDESTDVVFSSISFHHWANQMQGIREVARVLSPGGIFCLADHEFVLAGIFGEKVRRRDEISRLVRNAGLSIRTQQGTGMRFVSITIAQK